MPVQGRGRVHARHGIWNLSALSSSTANTPVQPPGMSPWATAVAPCFLLWSYLRAAAWDPLKRSPPVQDSPTTSQPTQIKFKRLP